MRFSSPSFRHRPDQTVYTLNEMLDKLSRMESSIRVTSEDKKSIIIIGNQPVNPSTGKPFSFGIHTYKVLGDRLEEV